MAQRPAQENQMGHQPGSVENALRTFQLLRDRRSLRVAELATELGVARSTAHRLLTLLSSYGAVEQRVHVCRCATYPATASGQPKQHAKTALVH